MRFSLDANWIAEVARQSLLFVIAMGWWQATDQQQALLLSLISVVASGVVGQYTASSRVLERAGTSVDHVKTIAAMPGKVLTVTDDPTSSKD